MPRRRGGRAVECGGLENKNRSRYVLALLARQSLNQRVLPELGNKKLTTISSTILQDFADQLSAKGLSPSTVRNTLLPIRAIYRRAHARGEVAINPTLKLSLPAVRGRRDRIAAPAEVTPLLDVSHPGFDGDLIARVCPGGRRFSGDVEIAEVPGGVVGACDAAGVRVGPPDRACGG